MDSTKGGRTETYSEEIHQSPEEQLSAHMYYTCEQLQSRPSMTEDEIPENLLHLSHSFGYDSGRRANLHVLDDRTLSFIAGNFLVVLDIPTKQHNYIQSCSGGGIGAVAVHPNNEYFAVAERGDWPHIIVYEFPSRRPYRVLRGGAKLAYSCVNFSHDGTLLASVSSAPDFMLTLWDWRQERMKLSCKAFSQDVFRVTFSPHNPGQLTSSGFGHIKFWQMARSFTGLKLQGKLGRFGNTAVTDIEGYVELPDGKVVSGSDWGNLLLWDDHLIKLEISRKAGRSCHCGKVQPFVLEEGQLMTFGSDGTIRGWDFDAIDAADCKNDGGVFEMEPMNEMVIGHVNICTMVRSPLPDSFIWFAQDRLGSIWKLDLSFTNTTPDPECLLAFHAGPIQGMAVSSNSHLMATTALDGLVKVFDFVANRELTSSHFTQGGTVLTWAPSQVSHTGGLLVTGFEDGVVRLLELYDPMRLHGDIWQSQKADAKLHLNQALKPHNESVTAIAYDRKGEIIATGSTDCTVFFFTVGDKYNPIGFVQVPGPVVGLEWSPPSHRQNTLLILCKSGHVVEVQSPGPDRENQNNTYLLSGIIRRCFRFRSIKSRIKREQELARYQAAKEKRGEEGGLIEKVEEQQRQQDREMLTEKEGDETLPLVCIPHPPSHLLCGFYSVPGQFWLSMGGFDSGALYHCKFPEKQVGDVDKSHDEPFAYLPVHNSDDDPICAVRFTLNRQMMICGMHSGGVRIYPLQSGDDSLASMKAYWRISIHDNQYGHLQHIHCSHDDHFVLTAGGDGNIFSFNLISPGNLQKALQQKKAKVPSPRVGLDTENVTQDIEDSAAYSIETSKQKLKRDQVSREAKMKVATKRKLLNELQKRSKEVLEKNQSLQVHVWLQPQDLQLDQQFFEKAEILKADLMRVVRKELAWEEEHCCIALKRLRDQFGDSFKPGCVVAIHSRHRLTMYHLRVFIEHSHPLKQHNRKSLPSPAKHWESKKSGAETSSEVIKIRDQLPALNQEGDMILADRQMQRLHKAAQKAEQARAKFEKRKREWAQLYAQRPPENCEDPQDVQAISDAKENIGDLKLKSAEDFVAPKNIIMNAHKKGAELATLEKKVHQTKTEMNEKITALQHLKETLYERLQRSDTNVKQYQDLKNNRRIAIKSKEDSDLAMGMLEWLKKKINQERRREQSKGDGGTERGTLSLSATMEGDKERKEGESDQFDFEEEVWKEKEMKLLHEQGCLLEEMEEAVLRFDAELCLLCHEKLQLDAQLKLADLCHLTFVEELLLIKEFVKTEESLQEKLHACMEKESNITCMIEACNEQLEMRNRAVDTLRDREKSLLASFKAMVVDNKYCDFLTKLFKKNGKRMRNKEETVNDVKQEDVDEDSDSVSDVENSDDDEHHDCCSESGGLLDDGLCPTDCDPDLFEKMQHSRELRQDIEEQLQQERKCIEALKKDRDALIKKEKVVQNNKNTAEKNLESVNKEKLQKMNEVDVVVPLTLHQIEFLLYGTVPMDLSPALVVERIVLKRLLQRITELQVEKSQQTELFCQARLQHVQLIQDHKDMKAKIQGLQENCNKVMTLRFGRLVDLETLQTLSGNRLLEELKQKKVLRETVGDKEIQLWEVKVAQARQALWEVTRCNTELLLCATNFIIQGKELEDTAHSRQRKSEPKLQNSRMLIQQKNKLHHFVTSQAQQAQILKAEIGILSLKGGCILLSGQAPFSTLAN